MVISPVVSGDFPDEFHDVDLNSLPDSFSRSSITSLPFITALASSSVCSVVLVNHFNVTSGTTQERLKVTHQMINHFA